MEEYLEQAKALLFDKGLNLLGAIVIIIVGLWLVKKLSNAFAAFMEKRSFEASLKGFLNTLINALLKIIVFISALGTLGVEMTSFVAILAAAGFAVGMALSGTLSNFAGGVIILLLKPFKVGNFIEAQGYMGTVTEIQIFYTKINTVDNKVIFIPNGALSNSSLTNFSVENTRRVDWVFGIAYGDSYEQAKEMITKFIQDDERILKDPEHFIALQSLGDSSVNIVVRAWVKPGDFWGVHFLMNERVYNEFPKAGLNIPFPQMDVHLHKD